MAHFRHTDSPTLAEIERQIRWEMEGVDAGVRRYRETLEATSMADSAAGKRIMREVAKPLVEAITAAQAQAQEGITNGGAGRQPDWWWTIQVLAPEQLAVIVLRAALSTPARDDTVNRHVTHVAFSIASSVKSQMDFEDWKADERRLTKEAKAMGVERHNAFETLKRRTKKVDERAWKKWGAKLGALKSEAWPKDRKIQIGVKLLELLVQASGGWFEIQLKRVKGKTERHLVLSDAAMLAVNDINSRSELNQPVLMPMICPPKPWRVVSKPVEV